MSTPRPLLLLDIDGVISLFGFDRADPPPGRPALIEGVVHRLSPDAAARVTRLAQTFECVWCSGWEDRADFHLPHLVGAPAGLPHIEFGQGVARNGRHWKLDAIEAFVGPERPVAWIDDRHDERCAQWLADRPGPGLLVTTDSATGLLDPHVEQLEAWAAALHAGG